MKCKLPKVQRKTIKIPGFPKKSPLRQSKQVCFIRKPSYSTNQKVNVLTPIELLNKKKQNALHPIQQEKEKRLFKAPFHTDRVSYNRFNQLLATQTPATPAAQKVSPTSRPSFYSKHQKKQSMTKRVNLFLPSLGKQNQHRNGRNIPWVKQNKKSQIIKYEIMQQIQKLSTIQQQQSVKFADQQSSLSLFKYQSRQI